MQQAVSKANPPLPHSSLGQTPAADAATLTATGARLRNPDSFAARLLLSPGCKAYQPPRL